MAWNPLDTPVDFFLLRGQRSPGIGSIEKASSPRKWDEVGGYGVSGSALIFNGRKLVPFDGVIKLYTTDDWKAWDDFRPLVMRPPYGERPAALDIWHPWLTAFEVRAAVVTDVLQPVEIDNGGYLITIQFLEFRKPKLTLAKPDAADQKPVPVDPADILIEAMKNYVQELA